MCANHTRFVECFSPKVKDSSKVLSRVPASMLARLQFAYKAVNSTELYIIQNTNLGVFRGYIPWPQLTGKSIVLRSAQGLATVH